MHPAASLAKVLVGSKCHYVRASPCYCLGMTNTQRKIVLWFYIISSLISYVAFLKLIGFEAYVRWSLNQDFSFLGGFGLEALGLLTLGQTLGLLYLLRSER